jgi:hypothetical protein
LGFSGKNVGHALAAQTRQMRVRNHLGKHDHDRIATDVGTVPGDPSVGVEHGAVRPCVAAREPWLPRKCLLRRDGIGLPLGELLAGDAANKPGVAGEFFVHPFEMIPGRSLGAPAA